MDRNFEAMFRKKIKGLENKIRKLEQELASDELVTNLRKDLQARNMTIGRLRAKLNEKRIKE